MSTDKKPLPTDVGKSFVVAYSKCLEKDPSLLVNFFKDDSLFTHKEANEAAEVVDRGRENIGKRLQSLEINEAVVDFQSIDCQEGFNGGVIVVLTGELKKRGTSKLFAQTFFLAPQQTGYYIHNYIFRVLKEHTHTEAAAHSHAHSAGHAHAAHAHSAPAAAAPHADATPAAAPAAASPTLAAAAAAPAAKEHAPKKERPHKEKKPAANAAASASANGSPATAAAHNTAAAPAAAASSSATAPAAASSPATAPAAAPAAAVPAGKKKPMSYASAASSAAPAAPAQPASAAAAVASPVTEKAPAKTAPAKPASVAGESKQHSPASLFVKNLPFNSTPEELQAEFSKFGKLRSLSPRKGFAFLEYETVEAADALLAASLTIGDRPLFIERRSKDSKGDKPKSDKSRDGKPKGDRPPRPAGTGPAGTGKPPSKASPKPAPAH